MRAGGMRARGFTLIEVLVVLAIVAMAMTVAPSLLASLPGERLRAAADDMTARIREAQSQAIGQGAPANLTIDPVRRLTRLSTIVGEKPLPGIIERLDAMPLSLLGADGTIRLGFLADGTASEATLHLRRGTRTVTLDIDRLTGRVRRRD